MHTRTLERSARIGAIFFLALFFLSIGGQAQQRLSELEVSDRLSVGQLAGIRLDLLELVSAAGLPKSGIVLGWGADLLGLGGNIILQRLPGTLIQDLVVQALEPQLQVPGLQAGTYHYSLTVLLDDYEVPQQSPVEVNVGDRGRVELRWRVNPQFVRLQRFGAQIGFRIYRAGPSQKAFAFVKELLNPDKLEFTILDEGLEAKPEPKPPMYNPTGNLILSGQLQLGSFATAPAPLGVGALYYDTTAGNLFVWNGQSWVSQLKGEKGDPGPKGEKGDRGEPGQPQTPEGALALLQQLPSPLSLTVANAARADFAMRAGSAISADRATTADRAATAELTDRAKFADQAKIADQAKNASTADSAKTADSATTAISAQKADSARMAESAGFAEVARQAEKASVAERATAADKASVADRATTAGVADRASSAERALRADFADRANSADRASNADRIGGLSISDLESRLDGRYLRLSGGRLAGELILPRLVTDTAIIGTSVESLSLFVNSGSADWAAFVPSDRPDLFVIGPITEISGGQIRVRTVLQLSSDGTLRAPNKQFVQDHPLDPTKEIVYVTLEGPEAAIFLRGTAQLVNGEATIALPDYFSLIASEQGLMTVQLTPVGTWLQLYVVEKNTQYIIVREASGKDGQFDYLVQAVRKGYEDHQVIQTKIHPTEMSKEALKGEELERLLQSKK